MGCLGHGWIYRLTVAAALAAKAKRPVEYFMMMTYKMRREKEICVIRKGGTVVLCGVGVLVVNLLVEAVWWLIQPTNGGGITCQGKHKY